MISATCITKSILELESCLSCLEGWLGTYMVPVGNGSQGIHGVISTFWASSSYVVGPYVMSSYGSIRGLCARARDPGNVRGRVRAENLADFYLRCQDPTTGLFVGGWGEGPLEGIGLVQQASTVAALWDLHRLWPNGDLARSATMGWQACLNHPSCRCGWSVQNQALRASEALILGVYARGDDSPSPAETEILLRVGKQVTNSQWSDGTELAGAIPQSLSDDRVIMPYQGKCLAPLVMLADTLHDDRYLHTANRLADFIVRACDSLSGSGLVTGAYIPQGSALRGWRQVYRLRHLMPFAEGVLRQRRRQNIEGFQYTTGPHWIARSFDTARGLLRLSRAMAEREYERYGLGLISRALEYQSPLGGIRNTLDFFGVGSLSLSTWQDVVPNTRWNSYAIQCLHELLAGTPIVAPKAPNPGCIDSVCLPGGDSVEEDVEHLRLFDVERRLKWSATKGQRWGMPARTPSNWNEGAAATGALG